MDSTRRNSKEMQILDENSADEDMTPYHMRPTRFLPNCEMHMTQSKDTSSSGNKAKTTQLWGNTSLRQVLSNENL